MQSKTLKTLKIKLINNNLTKKTTVVIKNLPKVLYHGSPNNIELLEIKTPRGNDDFNTQTGVYLTSNKIEAMLYSIARDKERNNKCWGINKGILYLCNESWLGKNAKYKLNKIGYLYEVKADNAEKNPNNQTEYIVKHNVIPSRKFKISQNMIKKYIKYIDKNELKSLNFK